MGGGAGLVAGIAFAWLLQVTGHMLPVARLVNADQEVAAWFVHLLISTIFGAIFGLVVATRAPGRAIGYAMVWGLVTWLVGWMFTMRVWLGLPMVVDDLARVGLAGHLLYGFVLGSVYLALRGSTRDARFHRLAY